MYPVRDILSNLPAFQDLNGILIEYFQMRNFDKSASSAIPIFNHENSKWELICPIGDCNMDIEKNEDNGEEILKFGVSVQAAKNESTIFTIEEVGPLFIGPISGILRATCVYKSVIRKG